CMKNAPELQDQRVSIEVRRENIAFRSGNLGAHLYRPKVNELFSISFFGIWQLKFLEACRNSNVDLHFEKHVFKYHNITLNISPTLNVACVCGQCTLHLSSSFVALAILRTALSVFP